MKRIGLIVAGCLAAGSSVVAQIKTDDHRTTDGAGNQTVRDFDIRDGSVEDTATRTQPVNAASTPTIPEMLPVRMAIFCSVENRSRISVSVAKRRWNCAHFIFGVFPSPGVFGGTPGRGRGTGMTDSPRRRSLSAYSSDDGLLIIVAESRKAILGCY